MYNFKTLVTAAMRCFEGLIDVDMKLSDEPPLGKWIIRAVVSGKQISRPFTVKEYGKSPAYNELLYLGRTVTQNMK